MTLHTGTFDAAKLDELARDVVREGLLWARTAASRDGDYADQTKLKAALEVYRAAAEEQVLAPASEVEF